MWTVLDFIKREETVTRTKIVNEVSSNVMDQHLGRTAKMLEKRKSMANLTMMYKKLELTTWLEAPISVYEKNK